MIREITELMIKQGGWLNIHHFLNDEKHLNLVKENEKKFSDSLTSPFKEYNIYYFDDLLKLLDGVTDLEGYETCLYDYLTYIYELDLTYECRNHMELLMTENVSIVPNEYLHTDVDGDIVCDYEIIESIIDSFTVITIEFLTSTYLNNHHQIDDGIYTGDITSNVNEIEDVNILFETNSFYKTCEGVDDVINIISRDLHNKWYKVKGIRVFKTIFGLMRISPNEILGYNDNNKLIYSEKCTRENKFIKIKQALIKMSI